MENIIKSFIEGPLPNILVASGVLFLFLSIVGKIGEKIAVDPRKQRYASVLGVILLLTGLGLHLMALVISTEHGSTKQITGHSSIMKTDINKHINDLRDKISEIDMQVDNLEKELTSSPQPSGPLHELQDIMLEREKRFEEIENLQTALRTEVEQLLPRATKDPGAKRRIEQIEAETIPDLGVEKRAVQTQLQELHDMIRKVDKRDELTGRVDALKEQKQSLQEDMDRLTRQTQPTANSGG